MSKMKFPVTFSIDEDMLPQVRTWKVGKKYKLELEVEQIGSSKGDEMHDDKKITGRFKVISATAEEPEVDRELVVKRIAERKG